MKTPREYAKGIGRRLERAVLYVLSAEYRLHRAFTFVTFFGMFYFAIEGTIVMMQMGESPMFALYLFLASLLAIYTITGADMSGGVLVKVSEYVAHSYESDDIFLLLPGLVLLSCWFGIAGLPALAMTVLHGANFWVPFWFAIQCIVYTLGFASQFYRGRY